MKESHDRYFKHCLQIERAIALMSMSMMIPIPGTNTLPAIAIFVIGFGLSEDDIKSG